jgi:hypothetical protein
MNCIGVVHCVVVVVDVAVVMEEVFLAKQFRYVGMT